MEDTPHSLRQPIEVLLARVDRDEPRTTYMAFVPLIGELQGAVSALSREVGADADRARDLLEGVKSGARSVGTDIRLASDASLRFGLRSTLEDALACVEILERGRR